MKRLIQRILGLVFAILLTGTLSAQRIITLVVDTENIPAPPLSMEELYRYVAIEDGTGTSPKGGDHASFETTVEADQSVSWQGQVEVPSNSKHSVKIKRMTIKSTVPDVDLVLKKRSYTGQVKVNGKVRKSPVTGQALINGYSIQFKVKGNSGNHTYTMDPKLKLPPGQ